MCAFAKIYNKAQHLTIIFYIMIPSLPPPRPSENVTLKHITVGRAAIATPPEPI